MAYALTANSSELVRTFESKTTALKDQGQTLFKNGSFVGAI